MAEPAADFKSYWDTTLGDLGRLPACPEVTLVPLRTNDLATLYGVHLTSLGAYRIFGYLSIPAGEGPFPAIYYTPRYQSVVQPVPQGTSNETRRHVITFSLAARGQRNADEPFAAAYPGWLTTNITDPERYVFKGVVADCVRGLEFLTGRAEVDPARIAIVGNDLAFITAALGSGATHVATAPELFVGAPELNPTKSVGYPRAEISDHLRHSPSDFGVICQTLALYDLRGFAPLVTIPRLIMAGPAGPALDSEALAPLISSAIGTNATMRESEQSGYKDGLALMSWLANQLRMPDPNVLLPPAWR